jgi:hypothetical protein
VPIEQTLCYAVGGEVLRRDDAKNAKLRANRGIGFEDVVFHIERVDLLDILEHPNPDRYAGQRIFVVQREDYVYLVPFPPSLRQFTPGLRRGLAEALRAEADVEDEHTVFLKTIIRAGRPGRSTSVKRATMKLDADEKELLESVERASGSPPAAGANERATRAMRRLRSARIVG